MFYVKWISLVVLNIFGYSCIEVFKFFVEFFMFIWESYKNVLDLGKI